MLYYFYILYSETLGKHYLGHSNDLGGRLRRHNSNHKGWTGKANDWEVVYIEKYPTKAEAYSRERQIKAWKSSKRIEELIKDGSS